MQLEGRLCCGGAARDNGRALRHDLVPAQDVWDDMLHAQTSWIISIKFHAQLAAKGLGCTFGAMALSRLSALFSQTLTFQPI